MSKLPSDFVWGVSTSSYQIEGAAREDGRSESIWDRMCHTPGKIRNGDTGDVACDHYHRYEEDIALMKDLGVDAYRFSIAWPRIIPSGSGAVNQRGLDFYRRLTEKLLEARIRPFATLYHWDLPQVLEDAGGWTSRDTAKYFGDYAAAIVAGLGDLVKDWMTLNEPYCSAIYGYYDGTHAPGRVESPKIVADVVHNLLLGHGLAVIAVREHGAPGSEVGIVLNPTIYLPASDAIADIAARDKVWADENGWWMEPLYNGRYPDGTWRGLQGARPVIQPGDMDTISQPTDFLGLNIYTGLEVAADSSSPSGAKIYQPESAGKTDMDWHVILPEAMYVGITKHCDDYPVKKIYVAESGVGVCADAIYDDGKVHDTFRVNYLKRYIPHMEKTVADGYPMKGYFIWSILDNFEWAYGYEQRCGITYVDFERGCTRIPKDSYCFYQQLIEDSRGPVVRVERRAR